MDSGLFQLLYSRQMSLLSHDRRLFLLWFPTTLTTGLSMWYVTPVKHGGGILQCPSSGPFKAVSLRGTEGLRAAPDVGWASYTKL